ncbi:hypothetical protein GWK47_019183 [Chionoecetes opilio]|uniref:Uncharacterized protein n=1 Tax=Chionoecetes opilio TaxID=41210 RepID=A0A8J4XSL9_CHIOP|nr:hypothetical protein GWK47_019183 [Chionoecetes opilio]
MDKTYQDAFHAWALMGKCLMNSFEKLQEITCHMGADCLGHDATIREEQDRCITRLILQRIPFGVTTGFGLLEHIAQGAEIRT